MFFFSLSVEGVKFLGSQHSFHPIWLGNSLGRQQAMHRTECTECTIRRHFLENCAFFVLFCQPNYNIHQHSSAATDFRKLLFASFIFFAAERISWKCFCFPAVKLQYVFIYKYFHSKIRARKITQAQRKAQLIRSFVYFPLWLFDAKVDFD